MNKKLLKEFVLKSPAVSQVIAALGMASFSVLTLANSAQAQTSPEDQSPVTAVEIHGKKPPTGPHCIYMNAATLPVNSLGGLLSIEGGLNGSPTPMIVDTGALHSALNRQEADKLGLKLTHSKITESDTNGGIAATYAAIVNDISLDKIVWHNTRLGVVSHVGESYSALAGADILLNGYHRDLEFSLATGQIKIFEPSGCEGTFLAYWDHDASEIPLVNFSDHDPRQIVTVEINGKEMTALIDSGTPTSMINLETAARLGVTPLSAGVTELKGGFGLGKQSGKAWLASFNSFTIGRETIKNPKIGIADLGEATPEGSDSGAAMRLAVLDSSVGANGSAGMNTFGPLTSKVAKSDPPDMLLGADFLRSHRVLLAMSQRRLYFSYLGGKVFGNDSDQKLATAP